MHTNPVIREITWLVEEQALEQGVGVIDRTFLTQAQAAALMKHCDIEALFLDEKRFDDLMEKNPKLLEAFVTIDLVSKYGVVVADDCASTTTLQ